MAKLAIIRRRLAPPRPDGGATAQTANDASSPNEARALEASRPQLRALAHAYRRWTVPWDDLIQEAAIGWLRAFRRFDPSRNVRLGTYASFWIRAALRELVMRDYRLVRIGTTKEDRRIVRAYRSSGERDPSHLADIARARESRVLELAPHVGGREASIDAPLAGGGSWHDLLASESPDPETILIEREAKQHLAARLANALELLDDRERAIVRARLLSERSTTLEALGARFGVSKERVRQLEVRAKEKLRQAFLEADDEAA